jgi:hypothetical protein
MGHVHGFVNTCKRNTSSPGFRRRKRSIEWYSHYWGTPRFLPDKPVVHWLFIPLGSALIAIGCLWLFPLLGVYLYVLASLQMMDATDTYRARRIEKLDRRDQEIEMESKTAELELSYRGPLDLVHSAIHHPSRHHAHPPLAGG